MDQQQVKTSLREAQLYLDELLGDGTRTVAERAALTAAYITELLGDYRAERLAQPFKDVFAEIYFFKFDLPGFDALPLFYERRCTWLGWLPKPVDERREFFLKQLVLVRGELAEQPFLYQYYRNGFTGLDEQLFVRGAAVSFMLLPDLPGDPGCSTQGSRWFARLTALEMLEELLRAELRLLDQADLVAQGTAAALPGLRWTAKLVHLVELGYGLWLCGAINEGDAKLQDIMDWLGRSLGVETGTPANYFRDIRRRKRLTRTAFLDSVRVSLNDYMDEIDDLPPGVRKRRRNKLDIEGDTDYLS